MGALGVLCKFPAVRRQLPGSQQVSSAKTSLTKKCQGFLKGARNPLANVKFILWFRMFSPCKMTQSALGNDTETDLGDSLSESNCQMLDSLQLGPNIEALFLLIFSI